MSTPENQLASDRSSRGSVVANWPANPHVRIGEFGAEGPLTDVESEFQQTLRHFAVNVMRPLGRKIDALSAADIIAEGSPFWEWRRRYAELGVDVTALFEMTPEVRSRLFCIILEELGYGDGGLAISASAAMLPYYMSALFGNEFLMERFPQELIGCWAITEPDHGSDTLDPNGMILHPEGRYGRPNTVARIHSDRVVVNGQKSAWVSNGTIAEVCILYCAVDTGDGPDPAKGCVLVLPLDLPGISRGKPLEKLGQRGDPQGEIFFEDVEVPLEYMLAGPEDFQRAVYCIHAEANVLMGAIWTGVARSAYDMAHEYAQQRRQGGVPICRHQMVAWRLFHMFRRVESSCALTRRAYLYNQTSPVPALQAAMAAKVEATQTSFDVASEALQIFGGNGLTHEYPIEKIMRDARASMIEDGCNYVLAIKGGYYLNDSEDA